MALAKRSSSLLQKNLTTLSKSLALFMTDYPMQKLYKINEINDLDIEFVESLKKLQKIKNVFFCYEMG
jgi:hypothetical protein